MKEVMEEGRQGAVDVRLLAAVLTVRAGERGAAVEAIGLLRVAVSRLAGLWLDRPSEHSARHRFPDRLEFRHWSPLRRY